MTPKEISNLLEQYTGAWSEPDPQARQVLLQAAWHDTGDYTDPLAHAIGREELDGLIARFLGDNPGSRFTVREPVDHHHDFVRFFWTLHFGGGAELQGMDYGEIAADGRLRKIVGFF